MEARSPLPSALPGESLDNVAPLTATEPLEVVNALHQVLAKAGLHADIDLPQIVVVGSQSVGKTSVLQSLVGRDFLPSGAGIVTRRPLVLQLQMTERAADENALQEWAEFAHKPGQRFFRFEEVSREIRTETERVCVGDCCISAEPILMRIFSPCVVDLTLVDLPGLTKVPTGDQPQDISERIRSLVLRYISQKSTLILAVSAANVDLTTSDALALAREVDPEGDRTLGVLTKLDLAGESGDAIEALLGRVYPLRLGYVGVVCRNDAATKAGVTFEAALKAEEEFLAGRAFRNVASRCGIPHLARRLHALLLHHIRLALPELRARVQKVVDHYRSELASYGDTGMEQQMGQGAFLLHVISGYVRCFADALEGKLAYSQQEAPPDRLVGGARLHHIFHRVFAQAVLSFDAFSGLSDMEIRVAMRNAAGPKPQLFVPEVAFETLVKRQIEKLEDPSLQCVHQVFQELKNLSLQSEVPEMRRYPALKEKVLEVAQSVISRCLQPTNQMVSNLIRIELAHINIDHPDFIGGLRAMSSVSSVQPMPDDGGSWSQPVPRAKSSPQFWQSGVGSQDPLRLPSVPNVVTPSGEPSEKERMDTELLKSLVSSYFAIVKRKIVDAVPKTIMHFMVNTVRDALHHECIGELYRNDMFTKLLNEADDVREGRLECIKRLEELSTAQDILARVRDTSIQVT
mmetsp:Transcript_42646/g.92947  ORF Transcript_42646/g.92947 Transcript_42646/m.92947 type:complete len:688 (+) Transcript_42646:57-2120(+)